MKLLRNNFGFPFFILSYCLSWCTSYFQTGVYSPVCLRHHFHTQSNRNLVHQPFWPLLQVPIFHCACVAPKLECLAPGPGKLSQVCSPAFLPAPGVFGAFPVHQVHWAVVGSFSPLVCSVSSVTKVMQCCLTVESFCTQADLKFMVSFHFQLCPSTSWQHLPCA